MEWQAQWINPENYKTKKKVRYPASCLKKEFNVSKGKKYVLYATARGNYAAFINGKRVEGEVLAPGPLQEPALYLYQSYAINPYLKDGVNEIVFILMDGYHRGSMGFQGMIDQFGTDLALLAQIDQDGDPFLATDNSWLASQEGPVRFSDMLLGETYDARKEKIGDWHQVTVINFKPGSLKPEAEDRSPITEHERFPGKDLISPKGEHIVDFGQNLAGYPQIDYAGHEGETIILELTESLDKDGNFQNANFQSPSKNGLLQKQTVEYICKEGKNLYKPLGAYYGYRFARVSGTSSIKGKDLTSIAVYSDFKIVGDFTCGIAEVNKFFSNALWSFKSNFQGIPTDCPTREKSGWTGDYQTYIYSALYLGDVYKDSLSFLNLLSLVQWKDGRINNTAPDAMANKKGRAFINGSAGWADAITFIPYQMFERYNDPQALKILYPAMKKWADFDLQRARKTHWPHRHNPYKKYLLDHGYHWGEWLEPGVSSSFVVQIKKMFKEGEPEVATAYLYMTCKIVSLTAGLLGKKEEQEYYAKAADNCRKAYNWQFAKGGKLAKSKRMCNYVRPLQFGLLDDSLAKETASYLNKMLIENSYRQNTGFLTTHVLLKTLVDYGYVETAYRTFLHKDVPGWLYPISKGATTIWEDWEGIDKDGNLRSSQNHYAFGSAVSFLFDSVCGIRLVEGKLTVCPHPYKEMGFARASYDSPVGKIVSAWDYRPETPSYHLEVPVPAVFIYPDGKEVAIKPGEYDLK
jgi:alpha-L-rhamnosidase